MTQSVNFQELSLHMSFILGQPTEWDVLSTKEPKLDMLKVAWPTTSHMNC